MEDLTTEINNCIRVLKEGGLILYPTDTAWAIGCDATNEAAVGKIYSLKKRPVSKAMICMVANDGMLERHVAQVPELAFDIMDLAMKPTTIVYDNPKGVAKNLIAPDNTLAIRVASDKFCTYLINSFKNPIVATTAAITGEPAPANYSKISLPILKGVDYVVNLHRDKKNGSSSIIKLGNDGTVKVIRE